MCTGAGRKALIALSAGALVGAVVLGIGGRLSMAALVLLDGKQPSFSVGGSAEVVLLGAGYGAVGGLLLLPLRRIVGGAGLFAGALTGLLLFALAWVTSRVGRSAAAGLGGSRPLALSLATLAFLVYGIATTALLTRWLPRR